MAAFSCPCHGAIMTYVYDLHFDFTLSETIIQYSALVLPSSHWMVFCCAFLSHLHSNHFHTCWPLRCYLYELVWVRESSRGESYHICGASLLFAVYGGHWVASSKPSHGLNQCSALGPGHWGAALGLLHTSGWLQPERERESLCKYSVTHGNAIPARVPGRYHNVRNVQRPQIF